MSGEVALEKDDKSVKVGGDGDMLVVGLEVLGGDAKAVGVGGKDGAVAEERRAVKTVGQVVAAPVWNGEEKGQMVLGFVGSSEETLHVDKASEDGRLVKRGVGTENASSRVVGEKVAESVEFPVDSGRETAPGVEVGVGDAGVHFAAHAEVADGPLYGSHGPAPVGALFQHQRFQPRKGDKDVVEKLQEVRKLEWLETVAETCLNPYPP